MCDFVRFNKRHASPHSGSTLPLKGRMWVISCPEALRTTPSYIVGRSSPLNRVSIRWTVRVSYILNLVSATFKDANFDLAFALDRENLELVMELVEQRRLDRQPLQDLEGLLKSLNLGANTVTTQPLLEYCTRSCGLPNNTQSRTMGMSNKNFC